MSHEGKQKMSLILKRFKSYETDSSSDFNSTYCLESDNPFEFFEVPNPNQQTMADKKYSYLLVKTMDKDCLAKWLQYDCNLDDEALEALQDFDGPTFLNLEDEMVDNLFGDPPLPMHEKRIAIRVKTIIRQVNQTKKPPASSPAVSVNQKKTASFATTLNKVIDVEENTKLASSTPKHALSSNPVVTVSIICAEAIQKLSLPGEYPVKFNKLRRNAGDGQPSYFFQHIEIMGYACSFNVDPVASFMAQVRCNNF